jgi:nucleotide-binding universal stress UspA family protein
MNETFLSPVLRPARVVVGVTGSAGSGAALRRAVDEARRSGSELVPVYVWQPPGGEAVYRTAPTPDLMKIWKRRAEQRLESAIAAAIGSFPLDLHVQPLVVRAPTVWALTELAGGPDDLLVLGAGPRHPLARRLRGAVRRNAAARAKVPVLLVKPPAVPRAMRRELRRITPEDFLRPADRDHRHR